MKSIKRYKFNRIIRLAWCKLIWKIWANLQPKSKVKVELLQTTIVSQADFECSKYSRSIYVIDVKSNQNFSCGLTNISDNTFDFLELKKIRIPLYREDQFFIHGLNVQHDIHSTVRKTSVYGLVYFLNCRSVRSLLIQMIVW